MTYREPDDAMETAGALLVLLVCAIGIGIMMYILMPSAAGALECRERPDGRSHWTYRVVDGDRCWTRGYRHWPKSRLHWREKDKIIVDPVVDKIRAEAPAELIDTTWHMARPFDEAQPINPPLLVQDDPDVWPKLSEFEGRFIGRQQ